jgi:hypothetical protein
MFQLLFFCGAYRRGYCLTAPVARRPKTARQWLEEKQGLVREFLGIFLQFAF